MNLPTQVSLAGPGVRECAQAQRKTETLASELQGPLTWPAHDMSYAECMQAVNRAAPALSSTVKELASAGKAGEAESVCGG